MFDDDKQPTPQELLDWLLKVGMPRIAEQFEADCSAIGIATYSGAYLIVLRDPVDRQRVRDHVTALSQREDVVGFMYVTPTGLPTQHESGGNLYGLPGPRKGNVETLTIAAATRDGRWMQMFKLHPERASSSCAVIEAEPLVESDTFLTWALDGIWEKVQ